MSDQQELIRESIMRDMSEGVMTISFMGEITYVNPAALTVLQREEKSLLGKRFAAAFFEYEENDSFTQTILDAVYDRSKSHTYIVPYFTGEETRQLHCICKNHSILKNTTIRLQEKSIQSETRQGTRLRVARKQRQNKQPL